MDDYEGSQEAGTGAIVFLGKCGGDHNYLPVKTFSINGLALFSGVYLSTKGGYFVADTAKPGCNFALKRTTMPAEQAGIFFKYQLMKTIMRIIIRGLKKIMYLASPEGELVVYGKKKKSANT